MHLHKEAQLVLDLVKAAGRPPFETLTPAEARAASAASRPMLQPDPPEVAEMRDLVAGTVPVRLYRGLGTPPGAILPCLIYFHGGGWVIGDIAQYDQVCRRLANLAGCCVISVEYRLAPEHRFPAGVEDCASATGWIIGNAASLAIDPARIAVGGDSAGGNLSAVMCLMARDGTLPPIGYQVLIYPAVDLTMTHPSYDRITDNYLLTATTMRYFVDHYVRSGADPLDWRVSPLRAASLAGVAPALVVTVAHDPLCDEGTDYAQRLEREGVAVTHMHVSDQMHAYLTMGRVIRASDTLIATVATALRGAWSAGP